MKLSLGLGIAMGYFAIEIVGLIIGVVILKKVIIPRLPERTRAEMVMWGLG